MTVTITLSDTLAEKLQKEAETQRRSLQEVALDILHNALESADDSMLMPEAVVAKIQSTPADPTQIRPATGSLLEALQNAPEDPEFDLDTWNQQWAEVETEMKTQVRFLLDETHPDHWGICLPKQPQNSLNQPK